MSRITIKWFVLKLKTNASSNINNNIFFQFCVFLIGAESSSGATHSHHYIFCIFRLCGWFFDFSFHFFYRLLAHCSLLAVCFLSATSLSHMSPSSPPPSSSPTAVAVATTTAAAAAAGPGTTGGSDPYISNRNAWRTLEEIFPK